MTRGQLNERRINTHKNGSELQQSIDATAMRMRWECGTNACGTHFRSAIAGRLTRMQMFSIRVALIFAVYLLGQQFEIGVLQRVGRTIPTMNMRYDKSIWHFARPHFEWSNWSDEYLHIIFVMYEMKILLCTLPMYYRTILGIIMVIPGVDVYDVARNVFFFLASDWRS